MSTSSLPPCCAAAVAAEVALVIERYNETWRRNIELVEREWFQRGYDAAMIVRESP
jgi:hypothetical protein